MALNLGLELIGSNIGMSFAPLITFIFCVGCLLFYARNFMLGTLILLTISTLMFVLLYALGSQNYTYAILVMFISVILLAMSLYGSGKDSAIGGLT